MDLWNPEKGHDAIAQVSTHAGNAVSMVAGLETMTHLTPTIIEVRNKQFKRLKYGFQKVFDKQKIHTQVTGIGWGFAFHLTDKTIKSPSDSFGAAMAAEDIAGLIARIFAEYRGRILVVVTDPVALLPLVDALLLDSGRPDADRKTLGGTGEVHDWTLSRRIVATAPVPVWLAGGLRPENVAAAVATVRPHGVDVCSGVRGDGRLDERLLTAFCAAAREA